MKIDITNGKVKMAVAFLVGVALSPVLASAARVATPLVTSIFPQGSLFVNLLAPTVTVAASSTAGSLGSGSTLYFEVTSLDGQGESIPSPYQGTTTPLVNSAFNLTWPAIRGAVSYRVYFSTSTPQLFSQYFTATTTTGYNFTSTSSPTYVSAPTASTAYAVIVNSAGNSWFNGGNIGVGTSTPIYLFSVSSQPTGTGVIATTTTEWGDQSTTTSRTCYNVNTSAGTKGSFYMNAAGTIVAELKSCL